MDWDIILPRKSLSWNEAYQHRLREDVISGIIQGNGEGRYFTTSGHFDANGNLWVSGSLYLDGDITANSIFLAGESGLYGDLEQQIYNTSGTLSTEIFNASGALDTQLYSASGLLRSDMAAASGDVETQLYAASGAIISQLYSASGTLDTLIDNVQAEWVAGSGALDTQLYSASGTAETRLYTVSGALGVAIGAAQTTATDAYNNALSAQSSANAANGALINKNGTTELTADWNVGSYPIRAYMLSGTYVIGDDIFSSGLIYSSNQIWAGNTVWAMGELWYGAGGIWTQIPAVRHDDAWTSGYAHITNNGSDHSYLNQAVLTTSTPQFARLGVGAAAHASGFLYVKGGEYNFPIVIFEDNHSPIRQMGVSSIGLWRRDAGSDTDSAALEINRQGYNDGDTYFRDLSIMDGKGVEILRIDGSAHGVILSAPLYADPHVSGQLWVNGTTVTMSVG